MTIGDIYLSLDESLDDIYYKVVETITSETVNGGTILVMQGIMSGETMWWPLLFLDQKFVRVNETTVQILFGKGAINGTANDDQKG